MTKKIIIANWKMNKSFDDVEPWLFDFKNNIKNNSNISDIVLCPPAILLDYIDELLLSEELDILQEKGKNIDDLSEDELEKLTSGLRVLNLGGQDCAANEEGAFTGDISAKMLKDAGCKYVIIGHSERRQYHSEDNSLINSKSLTALNQGLKPIICIGESLQLRQEGKYLDFIKEQIHHSIPKDIDIKDLIIAYEPIWSIGTGKIPSISDIAEVVDSIYNDISQNEEFSRVKNIRILYGGSVNLDNSAEILAINNISGLLVGGASLKGDIFAKISTSEIVSGNQKSFA
ncbi:triose-phosphate isomerase [Rickettsiales bacterium]|nr:triose-phosphate isomerase [Rickettsiales bacterium]